MAFYLSFSLILATTWLNASQTYIISYRAQVKNSTLISQSYQFSKLMHNIDYIKAEKIDIYSPKIVSINKILKNNKDKIIEFLMHYGVHTRSHEKLNNLKSSSLITITLPPTYITVDFNDDYATITRLIQK